MRLIVAKPDSRPAPPASRDDELYWVELARKGQGAAFNQLVLRWEQPIYNLALRMLKNPQEAEDATQEAFLAAFRNIGKFRMEAQFSTWLYRIASNQCLARLRKPDRNAWQPMDEITRQPGRLQLHVPQNQDREVLGGERRTVVKKALSRLGEDQRMVVELKIYQDLRFTEIAEILDMPLSTIKSRFYAALGLLRLSLGRGGVKI